MNIKKILGFFAVGGLLVLTAPAERAQALSLINPGVATAVQDEAGGLVTEVRWHRHHGWRHHGWRHHRWHRHRGWHHRHWGWRHRHWGWRHHRWHHRHWRW